MNRTIYVRKWRFRQARAVAIAALSVALISGCTSVGPGTGRIVRSAEDSALQGIQIVNLDDRALLALAEPAMPGFADTIGSALPIGQIVGIGDVLSITIWEAPPAVLFGSAITPTSLETSRGTGLPEYMVGRSGRIAVPFAGSVPAVGRTPTEIENDIVARLRGKAHLPQVNVRLVRNATATVSVVGDVTNNVRMPLTPKGESILDALAAGGGTKQPSNKITIQISRNGRVQSMPLAAIIRDPRQNVILQAGDVVTALYQPYSFTILGAAGKTEEINFEATGFTLAQALGRFGGLQDGRADPKGLFVFRWESPSSLTQRDSNVGIGPDGRIPVIYRIDMKDPATYFRMQRFAVRDKDVLYVANSSMAEFQRFVGIIASTVLPLVAIDSAVSNN